MNTLKHLLTGIFAFVLITIVFGFTLHTNQTDGDIITQKRTVSPFTKIEASTSVTVILKQGDTYSVTVTADANQIDKVRTTISQGTLNISVDKRHLSGSAKIEVVTPSLKSIKASASADIRSEGELTFDKLDIETSSGSDVKLHINNKIAICNSSSGSDIHLKGKTIVLIANASSGSDFNASQLIAENGKITAESGADAKVNITDEAEFEASSGGSIKYFSQPHNITLKTSSGGDIEKSNKDIKIDL
jgi:hypothetical protein